MDPVIQRVADNPHRQSPFDMLCEWINLGALLSIGADGEN
jgi:hypothetical protein